MRLYRSLALSPHPVPAMLRRLYRAIMQFSIPAPKWLFAPLGAAYIVGRSTWFFIARVFFCEPVFKSWCRSYGKNVHTGARLHWIQGAGDLILGSNVTIDGACGFFFAARYTERPTFIVGDNSGIGHNCSFVVGKQIKIGSHCRIAASVTMIDSPGHPLDPEKRKAGGPANQEDVRPITIGDNVWIGTNAVLFPGVSVGDNSVIAMGAVVMSNVPPNVVVAGNPARHIASVAPK